MSKIVAVHGIGHQFDGSPSIKSDWLPWLQSGVELAGGGPVSPDDLTCVIYGDLFRRKGVMSHGVPPYDSNDVESEFENDLLAQWWKETASVDERVHGPDAQTMAAWTPSLVQRALLAMSRSKYWAGVAENVMIFDLKQVYRYFNEPETRAQIQQRFVEDVTAETRVVIGHSLGSVVAYEGLCAHPEWNIRAFLSLGSPLGVQNLIFHRLCPPPKNGQGSWPGLTHRWTNVSDRHDVVALEKKLNPYFEGGIKDVLVDNGACAHDVKPYLTAAETGQAVWEGLQNMEDDCSARLPAKGT